MLLTALTRLMDFWLDYLSFYIVISVIIFFNDENKRIVYVNWHDSPLCSKTSLVCLAWG